DRCGLPDVDEFLRAEKDPVVTGHVLWMWTRGRDDLAGLVGELRPAGAGPLAGSGLDMAGTRGDRPHAPGPTALMGDLHADAERPRLKAAAAAPDGWLQVRALVNLCRLGDGDAPTVLLGELDNFPTEWLPDLVEALHGLRESDARARLAGELA